MREKGGEKRERKGFELLAQQRYSLPVFCEFQHCKSSFEQANNLFCPCWWECPYLKWNPDFRNSVEKANLFYSTPGLKLGIVCAYFQWSSFILKGLIVLSLFYLIYRLQSDYEKSRHIDLLRKLEPNEIIIFNHRGSLHKSILSFQGVMLLQFENLSN